MKKIYLLLFSIVIYISVINPHKLLAQNDGGVSVITAGGGYSIAGIAGSFKANTDSANNDHFRSSPYVIGSYDIGLSKVVSLGLSYSYQSFKYYYDGYSPYRNENLRFTDNFTRTNYGMRVLFHFGKKESVDMYAGVRLGYTIWGISTNNDNKGYKPEDNTRIAWGFRVNIKNTHYTAQAIYGVRYFFSKHIGINAEISIGPPGFFLFGLNGRF